MQQQPDPLEPALQQAQSELAEHLQEACEGGEAELGDDSMAELLRLEESLLAAAGAAERAIALRKEMQREGRTSGAEADSEVAPAAADADAEAALREFHDSAGRPWRAWVVVPGKVRERETAQRYLGEYAQGWLAFETLDGSVRRRLLGFPSDWTRRSESGLQELLEQAVTVQVRRTFDPAGSGTAVPR